MKKVILIFCFVIALFTIYIFKDNISQREYVNLLNSKIQERTICKGIKDSRDFVFDGKGNLYIAFKSSIQLIDNTGKSDIIFADASLDINSIDYYSGNIYISSGKKILYFDISNKKIHTIIENIPNIGDYKRSLIKIYNDSLFVSIGAATNSGVVGSDNKWLKSNPEGHDISPYTISLKGATFGGTKNGAFSPKGSSSSKEQIIKGNFPGNSTLLYYNLKLGLSETYAWGIRNIQGLDFNSTGKIIASVGGIENRGLRPVKGDTDYIYEIDKDIWYGWPDFSGGDPLNSPRFSRTSSNNIKMLLQNLPLQSPPAPIYVHKNLSSLGSLAVDSEGAIDARDTIYFYDIKGNEVYSLDEKGIIKKDIAFNGNSYISSMKIYNGNLYLLDSKRGEIYNINKK